ncbi:cytochrome-c peroxidase [Flavobacterium gawalongense]|uniref:Cytochrome-c peroxidase n=1 Tax=Flavobacterium gawalongense TaxID=2594432 RepID=A0A553BQT8_9FLAO|nr:cytochrome c peroxidase [Flavobacterium gawalongense]TRW99815.1 cytochrome-c peroxidase [Flavobacterium gawalongense]TRX04121.1 cytochrome-c peroxidase [Flavobacterium gawalongense]TRX10606.1 cytochrome-c peroxidase [Flavobacterium gawalongense]TRX11755.1 cytochrome-c peroxidase [Flavobacterium gawalongense]TRX29547.1 cytochrome-c peroxidase [Flavobacterium gawalongense]
MKNSCILLILILLVSCQNTIPKHEAVNNLFKSDILKVIDEVSKLEHLIELNSSTSQLQKQFLKAHTSYKQVEMISEYYFPVVSKAINGPALAEFEENDGKTLPPEGFQVIEEFIFPTYNSQTKAELLKEMGILSANLKRLDKVSQTNELTDSHVFDAMRLEVFRIITLGITGFDSPIAQNSIPEALSALENIEKYNQIYTENSEDVSFQGVLKTIEQAKEYLKKNTKFNEFDRAVFIREMANPLGKGLYKSQVSLKIPFIKETRGLKTTAQTLFDKNVFDVEAFSAFPDYETTPEKIELGKLLFNDPILSGNNSRSCAFCHHADKAFTDGLEKAVSLDGQSLVKRNTPTLSNIAFQRVFFSDSRVNYLEDQAVAVITNENEMHGSLKKSVLALKKNANYCIKFKKAFPKTAIDEFAIKNALASYIRSLSDYDSKFDEYMRGDKTFNLDEIAGFNLFAGKAKCATCHFIPLTNGTVPPSFMKSESEVLGVPDKHKKLDPDLGKFELTKAEIHRNSFKTPTIRNIELTAPYMHNGVFKTLEEVIDFYNDGGGNGLGFKLENQTLPEDKLNLTVLEKKQLIAFMKTLADTKYSQY